MNIINPIEKQGQIIIINLHCSEMNVDWLHSSRLMERAKKGDEDEEIKKELERMDNTMMIEYDDELT